MLQVVLSNPHCQGFQYGVLRDFENEIARVTGATIVDVPAWRLPKPARRRLAHGTRYGVLREYLPRVRQFSAHADVVWAVLMGPEDTDLDRFRDWDRLVGTRILYLFDTFAHQLPALRRVLRAAKWDLAITSFHCAVPWLEYETDRKWHAVPQGVSLQRFAPAPANERTIAFSSYGRRLKSFHDELLTWSASKALFYDVSVAKAPQAELDWRYLYNHYAWHLRQSWFSVCWPVELTHPERAGSLSPITCRWFEAAASGAILVGRAPRDPVFDELFGSGAVIDLSTYLDSPMGMRCAFEQLWSERERHLAAALDRLAKHQHVWTWEARVREILALASLPPAGS